MLQHFLLKPVQRLPQYRLLLQDYLKNLDQNDDDFENTVNALRVVEDVASKAESFIKNEVKSVGFFIIPVLSFSKVHL